MRNVHRWDYLLGSSVGLLRVIRRSTSVGVIKFRCECYCGNKCELPAKDLSRMAILSCGCLKRFNRFKSSYLLGYKKGNWEIDRFEFLTQGRVNCYLYCDCGCKVRWSFYDFVHGLIPFCPLCGYRECLLEHYLVKGKYRVRLEAINRGELVALTIKDTSRYNYRNIVTRYLESGDIRYVVKFNNGGNGIFSTHDTLEGAFRARAVIWSERSQLEYDMRVNFDYSKLNINELYIHASRKGDGVMYCVRVPSESGSTQNMIVYDLDLAKVVRDRFLGIAS